MKALILAIRFVLELCGLAAFAYWGSRTCGSTAANVALAISAPLADAGATTAAIVLGVVAAVNTTLVHLQPEI